MLPEPFQQSWRYAPSRHAATLEQGQAPACQAATTYQYFIDSRGGFKDLNTVLCQFLKEFVGEAEPLVQYERPAHIQKNSKA